MSSTTSVSLSQARELYNTIVACEAKLNDLEAKAKTTGVSFAELYNVIQDVFSLSQRMGLPEDIAQMISAMQRMIVVANSLRIAILALQTTTPIGLAVAGLGLATSLITMTDIVGSYY